MDRSSEIARNRIEADVESGVAETGRLNLVLHAQLTGRLERFSREHDVSLFTTLLRGWALLLGRWTGHDALPAVDGRCIAIDRDCTVGSLLRQAEDAGSCAGAEDSASAPIVRFTFRPAAAPADSVDLLVAGLGESGATSGLRASHPHLSLSLVAKDDAIRGTIEYTADLFERQAIERMIACWSTLLEAMTEHPDAPVGTLPLLPPEQRQQILGDFNATEAPFARERLIHELFEAQAERTPGAVALIFGEQSLTYAQLDRRANQLARGLITRGIGPEKRIGLCVERSIDMVVGLLGILKAGAAYVPMDPAFPVERLQDMVDDAAPDLILTQERLKQRLPFSGARVLALDSEWSAIAHEETGNPVVTGRMGSEGLAYVIYTSGSTGKPKGVAVEHRGVVNFLTSMQRQPGITAQDRILAVTTVSFDIAALEIYLPLTSGATLVLASRESSLDPRSLMSLIEAQRITVLQATPATWRMLLDAGWSGGNALKVLCGGEALTGELAARLVGRVGELWNLYGPTETTIWSCVRRVDRPDTRVPVEPLGGPIANTSVYLLDRDRQPVPIGVTGELYIGGAGVARGYLNREELTAERFVKDPFSADASGRMYRTGDLGRWRADGTIEYLGRNDHQVKIRGFRIEPGEIEAQLRRHPQVKEAVVIAREDVLGEKRLVGYVIAREAISLPTAEELREHLKAVLPEYMVPGAFVPLDKMPLTPNGKLDRRALPAPHQGSYATREYREPQGEEEQALSEIWQKLLRVELVGRDDNFFELGGHSLLVVQMLEQLRQRGWSAEVRRVFESSTLSELAHCLVRNEADVQGVPPNLIPEGAGKITPQMLSLVRLDDQQIERIVQRVPGGAQNIQDIYPLAPLQEGILFHHLLNKEGGDTYVLPTVLRIRSRERLDELIAALQAVIDRHDILRTAVLWERLPQPVQVVYRQASLPVETILLARDRDPDEQVREWMKPEHHRLDLRSAPLMRLQIAEHPNRVEWYALLQIHHLVCDNKSMDTMLAAILSQMDGREPLEQTFAYRNHVASSLQRLDNRDAEAFFTARLADIDEPTAPFGLLDVHGDGSRIEQTQPVLDTISAASVRACARKLGVSTAALFHAAWTLALAHTSGREDVVCGTVLSGRLHAGAGAQQALGMFINTLPLRISLQDLTAETLVAQVQRELVELMSHEQASLVMAQRCSGVPESTPLFTALLNYWRSDLQVESELQGAAGVALIATQSLTNYPVTLSVNDRGDSFSLDMKTDRRIDPGRMCGYVVTALRSLVRALDRAPRTLALALDVMPQAERSQILAGFNPAKVSEEKELIHRLFEKQVERSPSSIAAVCQRQTLTYAALNRRANQLAHCLIDHGVRPDQRVALYVDRSLDMVVGVLAILKAGGAYVPLDPGYPADRLAHVLEDAAPAVLLVHRHLRNRLPGNLAATVIEVDEDRTGYSEENIDPVQMDLRSHHLAYVIYTSGSTGKPKGVMVEHRNVTRLFKSTEHWFSFDHRDVWSLFHSIAFDFSVWELWGALFYGGRVVVVPSLTARSPQDFYRLLCEEGVTVLNQTPSAFVQLIEAQASEPMLRHSLRVVVFGGEALELHKLKPWVERNLIDRPQLVNMYGITETTVHVTYRPLTKEEIESDRSSPIGGPIPDLRAYLLNRCHQPLPIGVTGELYIGGAGVARGYLNREALTAERFVKDPFSADPAGRMYRTGDLGRWRRDGTIEYLGRNDQQVKIRGFRIELGEIEAQLRRHSQVKEAVAIAREDVPGEKRLVAYVIAQDAQSMPAAEVLREHLKTVLPEYMVPSAFVSLEKMPLTPNGKLDRRALPSPQQGSFASREYREPQGEGEQALSQIWQKLLRVERVGRDDNFFELGGHSLLIVQMLEQLRQRGWSAEVRRVFESPQLSELARCLVREEADSYVVPPNLIPEGSEKITPQMLPLVQLEDQHIERIVQKVPGGAQNIQDIYPLAPLQEGILFHHLLDEHGGDTYVLPTALRVRSRERLEELIAALQVVIDRHDILRTAVLWEGLPQAVQVVYRNARLPVEQIVLAGNRSPEEQVNEWMRPERHRLDLRCAPLMRLQIAEHPRGGEWYALLQLHHITCDHITTDAVVSEIVSLLSSHRLQLPETVSYRDHVAHALEHARQRDPEGFFRKKLGDVDEPTAPFGLLDVRGDGSRILEAVEPLDLALSQRIRVQARRLGVSVATLFHATWGVLMARTSGRDDVVFGSVLLGRLQGSAGAKRVLGMFINTLPLRLRLRGLTVTELIGHTQRELAELLVHEEASLALAQRCSGVSGSVPLFSAFLNYRHSAPNPEAEWSSAEGVSVLAYQERANYPISFAVDDLGEGFVLTAQTDRRVNPERVVGYLQRGMQSLVESLERSGQQEALDLQILPDAERMQLLEGFNPPSQELVQKLPVQLFEEQVQRRPLVTAVEYEQEKLTYAQLNERANQLAYWLKDQGLGADQLVGICMERSVEMIVAVLAIWKAGAAYVPLDPAYPAERLRYMLEDAAPDVLLTQGRLRDRVPPRRGLKLLALDGQQGELSGYPKHNPDYEEWDAAPNLLAYVIYTSGSTGRPKGVMVEHRQVVNLWQGLEQLYRHAEPCERVGLNASLSFDASVQQLVHLLSGRTLRVIPAALRPDAAGLLSYLKAHHIEGMDCTPTQLAGWISAGLLDGESAGLKLVLVGGEAIGAQLWERLSQSRRTQFFNVYGPTECAVDSMATLINADGGAPHIGRPMVNRRVYVLDGQGRPAPLGVAGEICIGGTGVARGYLNRESLTLERFVADPFNLKDADDAPGRMYRTGDVGRWRADGTIEYLGRNDEQVKIRGYRIELGEIEAQLRQHPQVKDVVVLVREDQPGDPRLVAYLTARREGALALAELRQHMKDQLPEHMVPSALVVLETLPLTPSGKLDRRALPAPEQAAGASEQFEAPEGEVEQALASIWQQVLRVSRIGRHDNFFELGGHSLLAMQAMVRARASFSIEMPMSVLFDCPTVSRFSAHIVSARQKLLLERLAAGSGHIKELLQQVAAMPETSVQASVRGLRMEGQS